MFVCDIGCPRSPGKRTRKKTTPGATVRVTPDKVHNASEAHSTAPRGSWSASSSTVRRATPTQEYNLSLSEMRHYKDEDTMVLILSQNSAPAEEAEYPVPLEQDTSELLDAEDDDTLAGYAQVASRLIKPSPLQVPTFHAPDSTRDPARRLFYDDDVCHEQFNNHTYEADARLSSQGSAQPGSPSRVSDSHKQGTFPSQDSAHDAIPGFFNSKKPANTSSDWEPADPVVEPWMADGDHSIQNGDQGSGSDDDAHQNGERPGRSKSAAAERSQSRGRAFSPSGSNGRYSGSASPKVHNGSIHRSARAHNGASAGGSHQPQHNSDAAASGAVRVSNGARPQSSREARSEQRRASGRDMRSPSIPDNDVIQDAEPSQNGVASSNKGQSSGFWEQWTSSSSAEGAQVTDDDSAAAAQQSTQELADNQQRSDASVQEPQSPRSAQPFFSSHVPAAVQQPGQTNEHHEDVDARDLTESFFQVNPTIPKGYQAAIPAHYPRRPVPKQPPGTKRSPPDARQKDVFETEIPIKTAGSPRQNGHHSATNRDEPVAPQADPVQASSVEQDRVEAQESRASSDDKMLESQNDHASRSFARAVSHSSLPSAMPVHSVRRGATPQRNSAMRRSSRRDAHMQARIANLDTSNLSHYSLPTLQRLAKDMGLSNFSRLSKSELVVQLVAEIILANMTLGWTVPEVAHGHLDEDGGEEGAPGEVGEHVHSRSGSQRPGSQRAVSPLSGSPRTVYRFGDSYDTEDEDCASDVEVSPEVPPETVQRGQDVFSRIKHWLPFGGARESQSHSDHSDTHVQQISSENRPGGRVQPSTSRLVTGAAQISLGGVNVEKDFESLSALSMNQLQELCEDLGVQGWQRMRKYEMVGALLMDVYGLQQ